MFIFNKLDTWSHYYIEEQNLKCSKTKKINSILHSYKKGNCFFEGGVIAPKEPSVTSLPLRFAILIDFLTYEQPKNYKIM